MMRRAFAATLLSVLLGCPASEQPVAAGEESGSGGSDGADDDGVDDGESGCADACESGDDAADDGLPACTAGDNGMIDCSLPECVDHQACIDPTVRVATWNILRVGEPGSEQFEAEAAIVQRLDADVLCLEEVGEGEEANLQALADVGGYDYGLLAPASGPPGGAIAIACMSRLPTVDVAYLWSDWISPDPDARDMTRSFVRVRLHHEPTHRDLSVIAVHLKAGVEDIDRFRRMVENIRLGQVVSAELAAYPDNTVVAIGDFNESPEPSIITFDALPDGLPDYYVLGSDIQLPLQYQPELPMQNAGVHRIAATWEDGQSDATFIPYERRIDYIWINDREVVASEVYEACSDDGAGAPPDGDAYPQVGEPLACGTNELASDHRPVVAQIKLR